jgi:hypothetical protein
VARLLVEALEALRRDVPACYQAACRPLSGKRARCRIGAESFVASFGTRDSTIARAGDAAQVEVQLSRRAILALVRNQRSLHASVLSRELEVRGAIADVSDLGRSMKAFLHGAVRSPALPDIFARFERLAESNGEISHAEGEI